MTKSRNNRNRKTRKNRSNKRNRRQNGGGGGAGWSPYGALSPQAYYLAENKPYDACLGAERPGQIAFQPTGGLPGMSQKGGAYTNNLAAGTLAGFAQIDKVGCTPNLLNPLNPPAAAPQASPVLTRIQSGGVGLVGASDMGVYEASTARYMAGTPSPIISATGVPIMINKPLDDTLISRACVQTAGRRLYRKNKNNRKSRKNRSNRNNRSNRKNRSNRNNRSNRKNRN